MRSWSPWSSIDHACLATIWSLDPWTLFGCQARILFLGRILQRLRKKSDIIQEWWAPPHTVVLAYPRIQYLDGITSVVVQPSSPTHTVCSILSGCRPPRLVMATCVLLAAAGQWGQGYVLHEFCLRKVLRKTSNGCAHWSIRWTQDQVKRLEMWGLRWEIFTRESGLLKLGEFSGAMPAFQLQTCFGKLSD